MLLCSHGLADVDTDSVSMVSKKVGCIRHIWVDDDDDDYLFRMLTFAD